MQKACGSFIAAQRQCSPEACFFGKGNPSRIIHVYVCNNIPGQVDPGQTWLRGRLDLRLSWPTTSRMIRAGKFYCCARYGEWKLSLTSKHYNLLRLKGAWKLLSENKEFVVCAVEAGKSHIPKWILFILFGKIVNNSLKSVNYVHSNTLRQTRQTVYHTK